MMQEPVKPFKEVTKKKKREKGWHTFSSFRFINQNSLQRNTTRTFIVSGKCNVT